MTADPMPSDALVTAQADYLEGEDMKPTADMLRALLATRREAAEKHDQLWRLVLQKDRVNDELRAEIEELKAGAFFISDTLRDAEAIRNNIEYLRAPPSSIRDEAIASQMEYLARELDATRRSADARVAAAMMEERETILANIRKMKADTENDSAKASYPSLAAAFERHAESCGEVLACLEMRPTPTGSDPLAALLAEAREAGRAEMREMAAKACQQHEASWFSNLQAEANQTKRHRMCGMHDAATILDHTIRALPVKLPTPEAPRDEH